MEQDNSDNNNTKEEDLELNDKLKAESGVRSNSKLSELTNIIRRKPVIALTFISITIMVVSYFLSESGKTKESIIFIENRESREAISGIEQAVDLRAKWTEEILNEVKTLKDRFESVIESRYLETTTKINNFNQKDEYIKSNFLIHFGLRILPNQAMERTAPITKREALERNINAGMGKFFPDIQQEATDLAGVVAALQSGNRVVNIHFNVIMFDKIKKAKQSASAFCSLLRRSGWYFVPCKYDYVAVLLAALPMQLFEQGQKGAL
ncbi:conjugal transfer protein TraC [Orientia tsutsugamushi]|uniref:Conjugal transfer protein TraC n=1 Tax=Orientia tsutsugamushi TaxID=784 RepID=A0A2R8F415_ORITS|nr:conjugal transfer protein TraC [Orientia tsutsugamushi]